MKQTFAFFLSIAMLATTTFTSFAAVSYPVDDISSLAYVLDEDNYLDLSDPADMIAYGETAYFPLLSGATSVVSEKKKAYDQAKTAYEQAKAKYDDYKAKLDAYNTAKTNDENAASAITSYGSTLTDLEGKVTQAQQRLTEAQTDLNKKQQEYEAALEVYTQKHNAWEAAGSLDSGPAKEELDQAGLVRDEKKKTFEDFRDITVAGKQQAVTDAQQAVDSHKATFSSLDNKKKQAASELEAKQNALLTTTKTTNISDATTAVNNAKSDMEDKERLMAAAKTAWEAASNAGDYRYVYESDAVKSVKISRKWEESGNYVGDVSVVRKRVEGEIKGATTSSMKYIYCLAVEIESSTSTTSRDLLGTVTLKKSGSDGFEVTANIGVELGYSSASDKAGEGVIPTTPATFKEGNGFEAESDFVFEFKADSKSFFEVNTVGQGTIVLGFNNDYDDKIGNKYPDANLDFYNGNYASFNRVGKLYLSYSGDDDGYVYSIAKDGTLSRVEAEWDEYEDCYVITTRTLGRYVISDKRLTITSTTTGSSSSSSSKTSGSGSGTVVTPTPSSTAPSYTYTPPVSSSTPPPAASSEAPSSEPESEPEESEPEDEDEDEDEDEIVSVIIDDDDSEGPEKKNGISGWVWALIITGLTAVPVAIGAVYYLNNRPIRRDFFKDEDEYRNYEDDDYKD